jgi:hypothetical protein
MGTGRSPRNEREEIKKKTSPLDGNFTETSRKEELSNGAL